MEYFDHRDDETEVYQREIATAQEEPYCGDGSDSDGPSRYKRAKVSDEGAS